MKNYFLDIVSIIQQARSGQEKFTAWFSQEAMDYARFNHAQIRKLGTVEQQYLTLNLIDDGRHASSTIGLNKNPAADQKSIFDAMKLLREQLKHSEPDPYLMICEGNNSSENIASSALDKNEIVSSIVEQGRGLDLVGCYLGGPICKGFANSYGQINWFEKSSFIIDMSVYHSGDKAIKQSYADTVFDKEILAQKLASARRGLELFNKESMTISPGNYRVYFSPSAVYEIMGMINWGGFSRKSLEVKNSPLSPLFEGKRTLSKAFSLAENISQSVGPNFQAQGFLKHNISIIENGRLVNSLISPKTAREYRLDPNADESETLSAIDIKGGNLPKDEIVATLGDGLYINNLWYLNYSDRPNGCLTGMTRFFCFVVKNQKAVAPFSVMRFDDSIYRIFGENLAHLTRERELIIDSGTYDERSTTCAIVPGMIAENVRFTL